MTQETARLGEVLREAREAKGVDLTRVERDTKIRLRYLTALENADYRDLPGPVYVRGFLRNYGHYLDLDPDYLIRLYRAEAGALGEERTASLPRPLAMQRPRTFVITPGTVVTVILTLFVAVFIAYLGYQFLTFARTPELTVTDPASDLAAHAEPQYTIRGRTEPNSRVTVEALGGNPEVLADGNGVFEVTVDLVPGVNVITITASDPRTGRDSDPVQRTINVGTAGRPSGEPERTTLTVTEPADGASLAGAVRVAGETSATAVTVSATLVEAAPVNFRVADSAGGRVDARPEPPAPAEPLELPADDGGYAGELRLAPGTWELTISAVDGAGEPPAETRRVTITAPDGLAARVEVRGGPSWLELYEDGILETASSLRNAPDGANIDLNARRTIRIRAGSAGAVTVHVNGISLGTMGDVGEIVDWTVTAGS